MKYNTFTWWLQAWRRDGAIVHMKSFNTWCISICNAIIFELHDFLPTIQLSSGICQNTTREAESLVKPELQNTSCYSCCQCCILIIKSEIRIQMRQSDRKQPGRGSRLLLSSHLHRETASKTAIAIAIFCSPCPALQTIPKAASTVKLFCCDLLDKVGLLKR